MRQKGAGVHSAYDGRYFGRASAEPILWRMRPLFDSLSLVHSDEPGAAETPASRIAARLALVATVTASAFELVLLAVGGLPLLDHGIIALLIAGSAAATWLGFRGHASAATKVVIGTLWTSAACSLLVHGTGSVAMPTLTVSVMLAVMWGGTAPALLLIGASIALMLAANTLVGTAWTQAAPIDAWPFTILLVGQFVFIAAMALFVGRTIARVRRQVREADAQLMRTTTELAASMSARAATEARYADLVQALPDTVMVIDATGRILEVNAAVERMLGRTAAHFAGGRLGELGLIDDAARTHVYEALGAVLRGVSMPSLTLAIMHADGVPRWIEASTRLVTATGGEPQVLAILRDVTARRAAEDLLREREAQLRRASRIAKLGGWQLDLDTNVLQWDDEVKRIHDVPSNYQPDVAHAISFYAPEARPIIEAAFARLLTTGEPYSLELTVLSATGRRIEVRTQGEPEWRDGRIVKVIGVFQDVTELREAMHRVQAAEERSRAIIENSSDLITLFDADGTILFESPSVHQTLGLSPEEALGRNMQEWLHPDDREAARERWSWLVANPNAESTSRWRYRHADGEWRRLETVARNMLHVQGVHAVFAMARDITERERLEEQLRETQRLESLGLLAGGVAHDFNNLLTAILGYADELAQAKALDKTMAEGIGEIQRAGQRARELTTQLLTFARRQLVLPKIIGVERQLAQTERFLRRLIGENIALRFDVAPDAGHVRMDPAQFEQILVNLAANARDVMPDGGELVIEARAISYKDADAREHGLTAGDYVQLVVRDTGLGMTPTVAERIFEPFFTTKELGKGTGLGLATVYGIVRQAGGQIDVATRPGAGTSFMLLLPQVAPDVDAVAPPTAEPAAGGHERILLVEDDEAVRKLALRILRSAGYEVASAGSGGEAEQLASTMPGPVALLVTDVVMPGMSGPELAGRLEARWGKVPTLFVSGYTEERLQASDISSDTAFLAKPYNWQELLSNVRVLLDAQRRAA